MKEKQIFEKVCAKVKKGINWKKIKKFSISKIFNIFYCVKLPAISLV